MMAIRKAFDSPSSRQANNPTPKTFKRVYWFGVVLNRFNTAG